jgi:glycosyltransferase involved in cell wall biosynthesis
MAKVSILLPIYNASKRTGSPNFLLQMFDSIINQTHRNFELLIMDNQSIDGTTEVCQEFAAKDNRIKLYTDTQQRPAEDAQAILFDMATGDFIMCMGDDDLLNYNYLKALINELETNRKIDMAYTNGRYINVNNQILSDLITNLDGVYNSEHYYENFYKAIHKRLVLPVLNGIFKKEVFRSLMPYNPFDQLKANMDNLLMAKFFLNRYRASFVNYHMFYYRHRDRSLNAASVDWLPTNPILIWVYYMRHQLYFYSAVCKIIETTNQEDLTKPLKIATLDSCINQCGNLLNWVYRDLATDDFERGVLSEIYTQFKPVLDLRLPTLSTASNLKEHQNTMRLRCKIIQERVLGYIKTVVQDQEIVNSTDIIIDRLKNNFIAQIHA